MQSAKDNALAITCFAARFPARLSGDPLPKRKCVLPWGTTQSIDGPVILDESTVAVFSAFQKARGWDRPAIDFEHNTVPGTPANKESIEPRSVACFGVPVLVPGEGIILDSLEWTPDGIKHAVDYCDISPALVFQPGTRKVMGLHSAALTRAGAIDGVRAFSAPLVSLPTDPTSTGDYTMERTVLLALLGLADTATADDMLTAAKTLGAMLKSLADNCDAISSMAAGAKETKEKIATFSTIQEGHKTGIETLTARLAAAEGKLVAFSTAAEQAERENIIELAKRDGKVLPFSAEAIKTVPLDTLREVAGKTPSTVPMDQRTVVVEPMSVASRGAGVGDPEAASKVAARFGRTPEDLTKLGV